MCGLSNVGVDLALFLWPRDSHCLLLLRRLLPLLHVELAEEDCLQFLAGEKRFLRLLNELFVRRVEGREVIAELIFFREDNQLTINFNITLP